MRIPDEDIIMIEDNEHDQNEEIEEFAEIHLESDSYEYQDEVSDINDIPIFSEEFAKQIDRFHNQRQQVLEEAFRNAFIGEQTEDLSDIFKQVMRSELGMTIQTERHQPKLENDSLFQLIAFTAIGMTFACILIMLAQMIKNKRSSR